VILSSSFTCNCRKLILIIFLCAGGVCGSCVSKLVSGDVDQSWLCELDDGNVLTREQMAAGFILPCSAMPKSDLKIEYSNDWGVSILEEWKHTARA
jgi:ferredoxin